MIHVLLFEKVEIYNFIYKLFTYFGPITFQAFSFTQRDPTYMYAGRITEVPGECCVLSYIVFGSRPTYPPTFHTQNLYLDNNC